MRKRGGRRKELRKDGEWGRVRDKREGKEEGGRKEGQGREGEERKKEERERDLTRSRGGHEQHPSSLLLFPQGLSSSAPLPAAVGPWRLLSAGFAN